jgi:hypothetical protein
MGGAAGEVRPWEQLDRHAVAPRHLEDRRRGSVADEHHRLGCEAPVPDGLEDGLDVAAAAGSQEGETHAA